MIVGIDYSMTCPAACLWGESPSFWFAHQRTYASLPSVLTHVPIMTTDFLPRAEFVATALIDWIAQYDVTAVAIEDYAFSATGRVFHIGEHTGLLKYLLWKRGYPVRGIPPNVVKKFATGKGNADKLKMTAAFLSAYPDAQSWAPLFFPRTSARASVAKSPLADLADAYWIARYTA